MHCCGTACSLFRNPLPGVADASGRTGGVVRAILDFVKRPHIHPRTSFFILENVEGLTDAPVFYNDDGKRERGDLDMSNAAAVLHFIESSGFTPFCVRLCPRLYGHPQSRSRFHG